MKYYIILFALFIVHSMGFAFDGTVHDAFFLQNSLGRKAISYSTQDIEKIEIPQTSFAQSSEVAMAHKSKGKAFILSLVLPGLGERYAGSHRKAHFFMASEVTLWLTYAGFISYREWRKQDYKTFAKLMPALTCTASRIPILLMWEIIAAFMNTTLPNSGIEI